VSFEQQLRDANRWSVFEKGGYLYGAMLKIASAKMLALALPRASAVLYDFGHVSSEAVDARHVRAARSGTPELMVRWTAMSVGAYVEFALQRSGAAYPRAEVEAIDLQGDDSGQSLYRLTLGFRWAARD
jgi:hypothetical protein